MKRLIVILAFLFAILSLCACEGSIRKNTGIKAYELGYTSDGGDGGIHADEAPVWNQEHQEFADPEAKKSITIEFGGKHYSGDYVISSYEKYDNYQTDHYVDWKTGGPFSVIHDTGELNLFLISEDGEEEWPSGQKNPKEVFQDQAFQILSEHVPGNSLKEYELEYTSDEYFDSFHYYRRIDDAICAAFHITITKTGKPAALRVVMGPEREEIFKKHSLEEIRETIQRLSGDMAVQTLDEKLSEIYNQLKVTYKWEVLNKYLVQYDDAHLGLVYDLEIITRTPGEGGLIYESGMRIAILLTE